MAVESTEIKIERYGEQLGERALSCLIIADQRHVLSEEISDRLFSAAFSDMTKTADVVASNGFKVREIRKFWQGMKRGYQRVMASAGIRKIH